MCHVFSISSYHAELAGTIYHWFCGTTPHTLKSNMFMLLVEDKRKSDLKTTLFGWLTSINNLSLLLFLDLHNCMSSDKERMVDCDVRILLKILIQSLQNVINFTTCDLIPGRPYIVTVRQWLFTWEQDGLLVKAPSYGSKGLRFDYW